MILRRTEEHQHAHRIVIFSRKGNPLALDQTWFPAEACPRTLESVAAITDAFLTSR